MDTSSLVSRIVQMVKDGTLENKMKQGTSKSLMKQTFIVV
jgi:hypothetical protein